MKAPELRRQLLAAADLRKAARLSERASDEVNALLNEAGVSKGTSLLARALTANAIIKVAAAWWANGGDVIEPETFAAIRSLVDDLPVALTGEIYADPNIAERNT